MTQLKWNDVMVYILKQGNYVSDYAVISDYGDYGFNHIASRIIEALILKGYVVRKHSGGRDFISVTTKGLDALEGVDGFTWTSLY